MSFDEKLGVENWCHLVVSKQLSRLNKDGTSAISVKIEHIRRKCQHFCIIMTNSNGGDQGLANEAYITQEFLIKNK